MVPIRRLLMAGLVLVSTGCLIGCSDNELTKTRLPPIVYASNDQYKSQFTGLYDRAFRLHTSFHRPARRVDQSI